MEHHQICVRCIVRPNNTKTVEFGNRERFITGPSKEMVLGLKNPRATERFQQSPFKSKKVREGPG